MPYFVLLNSLSASCTFCFWELASLCTDAVPETDVAFDDGTCVRAASQRGTDMGAGVRAVLGDVSGEVAVFGSLNVDLTSKIGRASCRERV